MIRSWLYSKFTGAELFSGRFFDGFPRPRQKATLLGVADYPHALGSFKTATRTTAGTTTVVTAPVNGSLMLTDLLISGEKQPSSTVEVRFTDGTNTASIFLASQVDAPPNFSHPFRGRFQGWQDARIDMITSGAGDATVTVGYVRFEEGLPFLAWDALR